MQFDWWTFALQTINFAVLVWLLHRFLYRPVLRMIDARRATVDKQFADAAATEARAKSAIAEIAAARTAIGAEREAALKTALAQAEEAAAQLRDRAKTEAAALLGEARKTMAGERELVLAEARRVALDLGVEIARRLLAEVPTHQRAEAWLERVEQHLAALSPAERRQLGDGLNDKESLRVVTAVPLPDEDAAEWRARLGRALGDGIAIAFDVDAGLVAGAELHFPNAILRFSWRSALSTMRTEIEDHAHAR